MSALGTVVVAPHAVAGAVAPAFMYRTLRGPRTAVWCLRHMTKQAGGALAWDAQWRACVGKAGQDDDELDADAAEHEFLCQLLETMVSIDQLLINSLATTELICRRIQVVEARVNESAHLVEEGRTPVARDDLCICPALGDWIAEQLRGEAAALEVHRAARDERAGRGA